MKVIASAPDLLAPPELAEQAQSLIKKFHECSWWWNHDFKITAVDDVREVILALRKAVTKPGLLHKVCRNASNTPPAKSFADHCLQPQ